MINNETRRDDPGDQPKLLGELVRDCSFVVFRPDQGIDSLEQAHQQDSFEEGYLSRMFRVDGQMVEIMVDLPDTDYENLAVIQLTGKPERGADNHFFVRIHEYKISKEMNISQNVRDEYTELKLNLLPEYYPEIAEEAKRQQEARFAAHRSLDAFDPLAALSLAVLPDLQNDQIRKDLGLNQVGPEEIAQLASLIAIIRSDPDSHEFVREN